MIYYIISIILDFLLSSFISTTYQNINIFFPVLLVSSLPTFYIILKNKKLFFIIVLITGIIYDTIFSDIFLINSYCFILYSLFINVYYQKHNPKVLNVLLISILGIIFYDAFIFFILILTNYSSFKINDLYYKITRSILINLIYVVISMILLKSRIFGYKKRKKRGLKRNLLHNMF